MRRPRRFVALWTLATIATVAAFVVHLALRGKTVSLGYELGRARAEQARMREVKRVLMVESASYKTPERIVPMTSVPDRDHTVAITEDP